MKVGGIKALTAALFVPLAFNYRLNEQFAIFMKMVLNNSTTMVLNNSTTVAKDQANLTRVKVEGESRAN